MSITLLKSYDVPCAEVVFAFMGPLYHGLSLKEIDALQDKEHKKECLIAVVQELFVLVRNNPFLISLYRQYQGQLDRRAKTDHPKEHKQHEITHLTPQINTLKNYEMLASTMLQEIRGGELSVEKVTKHILALMTFSRFFYWSWDWRNRESRFTKPEQLKNVIERLDQFDLTIVFSCLNVSTRVAVPTNHQGFMVLDEEAPSSRKFKATVNQVVLDSHRIVEDIVYLPLYVQLCLAEHEPNKIHSVNK